MLNENRFIKFKSEKQRDSIKLKDNEINVLFYSDKNTLLSENFNSQKDLLNLFKKKIQYNFIKCLIGITQKILLQNLKIQFHLLF